MPDIQNLSSADFEPLLNQAFSISLSNGEEYILHLVEVKDLGDAPGPEFRKPFSLLFSSPRPDAYLPQHAYRLSHPQWEDSLLLFLVPLGPQAGMMRYQVIFA